MAENAQRKTRRAQVRRTGLLVAVMVLVAAVVGGVEITCRGNDNAYCRPLHRGNSTDTVRPAPSQARSTDATLVLDEEFNTGPGLFHDASAFWKNLGDDSQDAPDMWNVSDGMMHVTAVRRQTPSGKPFAGGVVDTRGNFSHIGGYLEARLKYPVGAGLWLGFWTYGEALGPDEIDVMEAYPNPTIRPGPSRYSVHVHNSAGAPGTDHLQPLGDSLLTDTFHIYGVNWVPGDRFDFYFDGVLQYTIPAGPFTRAQYPILNMSVGSWNCRVDADGRTPDFVSLDVDWVRWWDAKP